MAEPKVMITPSVLDRLIDNEPENKNEAPKSVQQSIEDLKRSVKRDVEWLLNTRLPHDVIPEGLEEVRYSLATFGLPDFVGMSSKDAEERKSLLKNLEKALRTFEPRLINLKVSLKELDNLERGVVFQVEADLNMEPVPEPIVFDTVLKVGSGDFEIV